MIVAGVLGRKTAGWVLGAVAVVALAAAALIGGYALVHVAGELADGHSGAAARWATMTFFAGAPAIVAYAALRARSARPRFDPRLALVVVLAIGLQAVLAAQSYFTGDDWIHIVRAHDLVAAGGLPDIHDLGHVVFIHYAPGLRLGYWGLERFAPLDWQAGLAALLVLFAGSMLLFHRILTRLLGDRRSNLVLVLLFGTSILLVTSFLWFADGLHKLPSTFLSLLAIDAYLTYWKTRSRAALVLSVAAVSLGSLFYVKALLVPLYLVMIRLLFLEERPRRALRVLWQERWTWLAFAPTVAIYLWNYGANYAHTRGPSPSLHLLGNYLWLNWFKGVTPALAGVEVGPQAAHSGVLFATVAQAVLIAIVAYSIHRKRGAWRAWLFWGVAFCVNAALVGFGRLATMGVDRVGKELRYDTEMSWLLPLALGFAFFPGTVAARPDAPVRARFRLPARAAVAAGLVAYLVAAAATGAGISESWRGHNSDPAKRYVTNVRADVARLAAGGHRLVAIDDQVPGFLIGSADHPLNRLEHLIPAIEPRLRVVVAAARPLQVGDDGHIAPALLQPLVSGRDAVSGSGRVRVVGAHTHVRGGTRCLDGAGSLRFDSKPMLAGQSLYAFVSYRVERRVGRPGMIVSTPPSGPGEVALDAARGQELVNLGRPLRVSLPRGARACVRDLAVGWLGANGR
ncbi:MAG: hypothetical protein QOE38_1901 [Thermoleophilaceae bacterium]|nr:hypothetical protein [Thermoleophilaceae bacterium]